MTKKNYGINLLSFFTAVRYNNKPAYSLTKDISDATWDKQASIETLAENAKKYLLDLDAMIREYTEDYSNSSSMESLNSSSDLKRQRDNGVGDSGSLDNLDDLGSVIDQAEFISTETLYDDSEEKQILQKLQKQRDEDPELFNYRYNLVYKILPQLLEGKKIDDIQRNLVVPALDYQERNKTKILPLISNTLPEGFLREEFYKIARDVYYYYKQLQTQSQMAQSAASGSK